DKLINCKQISFYFMGFPSVFGVINDIENYIKKHSLVFDSVFSLEVLYSELDQNDYYPKSRNAIDVENFTIGSAFFKAFPNLYKLLLVIGEDRSTYNEDNPFSGNKYLINLYFTEDQDFSLNKLGRINMKFQGQWSIPEYLI